MTVIFDAVSYNPIPGTVQFGDGHDDRGGGVIPNARAGSARNGSCEILVDDTAPTLATLLALRSGIGPGATDVTGTSIDSDMHAYDCLVDVEIMGDAVQIARVSWKGTIST